ncbi:MAG: hypothetical protein ABI266_08765, partial [Ginsengibacter sp.]
SRKIFFAGKNHITFKRSTEIAETTISSLVDRNSTEIKITLKGGPNAGFYNGSSIEPTCSMGLTGPKSFGNQYAVSGKEDNEFSRLQLLVDDYEEAKSGTDKFYIKVGFGKRVVGIAYEINGSENTMSGKKQGCGKLNIIEYDNNKIVHIEGITDAGVILEAEITCRGIVRNK